MKWLGKAEDCNLCKTPLSKGPWFVDGATIDGPWALMCPTCFTFYGVGLGIGKGQQYDSKTKEKIGG